MASDHRMLVVELDNCIFFGKHLPYSQKINASRLKSNDPRQVKKRYAKDKIVSKRNRSMEMVTRYVDGDKYLAAPIVACYEDVHQATSDIRIDVASHLILYTQVKALLSPPYAGIQGKNRILDSCCPPSKRREH